MFGGNLDPGLRRDDGITANGETKLTGLRYQPKTVVRATGAYDFRRRPEPRSLLLLNFVAIGAGSVGDAALIFGRNLDPGLRRDDGFTANGETRLSGLRY